MEVNTLLDKVIKDYELLFNEIEKLRIIAASAEQLEYATRYELNSIKGQIDRLFETVRKK